MKFKAVLSNQKRWIEILKSLEKIAKGVVMLLKEEDVIFIQNSYKPDDPAVWSCLNKDSLFALYNIQSNMQNQIAFEVELSHLLHALKSADASQAVTVKLTKKQGFPFCTFEILNQTSVKSVVQDVPISIMTSAELSRLQEPKFDEPLVRLFLPPLRNLQHVIDRYKALGDVVWWRANMAGELQISVDSTMVRCGTLWTNLELSRNKDGQVPARDSNIKCECKIAVSSISRVLHIHLLRPRATVGGFYEDGRVMLLLLGLEDGGSISIFVPLVTL